MPGLSRLLEEGGLWEQLPWPSTKAARHPQRSWECHPLVRLLCGQSFRLRLHPCSLEHWLPSGWFLIPGLNRKVLEHMWKADCEVREDPGPGETVHPRVLRWLDYCPRWHPSVLPWLAFQAHCCDHLAPPDPSSCAVCSTSVALLGSPLPDRPALSLEGQLAVGPRGHSTGPEPSSLLTETLILMSPQAALCLYPLLGKRINEHFWSNQGCSQNCSTCTRLYDVGTSSSQRENIKD